MDSQTPKQDHTCNDACRGLSSEIHEQLEMLRDRKDLLIDLYDTCNGEAERVWLLAKDVDVWVTGYVRAIQTLITNARAKK